MSSTSDRTSQPWYGLSRADDAQLKSAEIKSSHSIDGLHELALSEFRSNDDAIRLLNATYEATKANYIALLEMLRAQNERK